MRFKVFLSLARISIQKTLAYRATSIIMFFVTFLFFILAILSNFVYYNYTNSIAGLTFMDSINLINTAEIIGAIYYAFFVQGNVAIYDGVLDGDLDYNFIKPVNSFFFYIFKGVELECLIQVVLYSLFQVYLFTLQDISLVKILFYIIFVILGAWYYFLLNQLCLMLVFYFDRAGGALGIPETLADFASKPKGIYPKSIRYFFTYFIAFVMAYNLPIDILRNDINYTEVFFYLLSTVILTIIAYKWWFIAIKRYQSAN